MQPRGRVSLRYVGCSGHGLQTLDGMRIQSALGIQPYSMHKLPITLSLFILSFLLRICIRVSNSKWAMDGKIDQKTLLAAWERCNYV